MKNSFDIKEPDVKLKEIQKMQWPLAMMMNYFIGYAELHSLPVVLTSVNERAKGRTSRTHEEYRAVDISTRHWSVEHCTRIQRKMNEVYRQWATGPVDGIKRVLIYGDENHLDHFHMQIKRNIKIDI